MSNPAIVEWNVGDLVTLRKVHPCGSYQWEVYRVGADIGIRCMVCKRRLMLERRALEKRAAKVAQGSRDPG
ncbi:MAG: DUF951 domain-containing protein [Dehalococcoidia bacterium]|jgi:hypothetical protein|nr:DUF951 domain-containing protein [Dehalococcoidia bacterium]|tara:strand:+ start:126 stop:338 length:213 start_codon:yes stop_codon:yes gene_type:complete